MKEFACIICPRGCGLKVDTVGDEVVVEGNNCRRGYKYALQEYTDPLRTVTLNLRVEGGTLPVISAKTSSEVALSKVLPIAILSKKLIVKAPVKAGDVLFSSLLGAEIIATKSVDKAE